MKTLIFTAAFLFASLACSGQSIKPIQLSAPDMERGVTLMQAFADRKSTREFAPEMLSSQDLSDLLWAANGINRQDGKRTAPSAMNRQDIDIYVCMKEGAYFYDHKKHSLDPVTDQDIRTLKKAPVCLILVANGSGNEAWGAMDAGIVSRTSPYSAPGRGWPLYRADRWIRTVSAKP